MEIAVDTATGPAQSDADKSVIHIEPANQPNPPRRVGEETGTTTPPDYPPPGEPCM
jgi:hypothetical protein